MNSIWADFARMIYNVEVEVQGPDGDGAQQAPPPEWTAAAAGSGDSARSRTPAARSRTSRPPTASRRGPPASEPPVVQQRRVDEHDSIGRNDPCWCGSGKKFKKCHGA